jgi:hydrocephalus-inducing protein
VVTDNAKYKCDLAPLLFRPTMMFQTRTFTFPLENTGLCAMDFSWRVELPDGSADNSGLFVVTPDRGRIQGRHLHMEYRAVTGTVGPKHR